MISVIWILSVMEYNHQMIDGKRADYEQHSHLSFAPLLLKTRENTQYFTLDHPMMIHYLD